MKTTINMTIGCGVLISVFPVLWMGVITYNSILGIGFMPQFYSVVLLMCVMWWAGLIASCTLIRNVNLTRPVRKTIIAIVFLGVMSGTWFEYISWNDSKQLFFPGFILIPFIVCLIVGGMLANKAHKRDAQNTRPLV